jgi:hypothetical protein
MQYKEKRGEKIVGLSVIAFNVSYMHSRKGEGVRHMLCEEQHKD